MDNKSINFFREKAYHFYPKGKDFHVNEEAYKASEEHKNFLRTIASNKNMFDQNSIFGRINFNEEILIRDYSQTKLGDRCLNIQAIRKHDDFFVSLCFNISLLIPFYCTYFLKTHIDGNSIGWKGPPKIFEPEKQDCLNTILKIGEIQLQSQLTYNRFPFSISSEIIPDLSYYDIRHNNLTYFNAFFLNTYYTRL